MLPSTSIRPPRYRSALVLSALLSVCGMSAIDAQPAVSAPPEWAQRYLDAEARGERFGHAWLTPARRARAQTLEAERLAVRGLPAPPPGMRALKGTFRMPVLAATYSDVTPRYTPAQYETAFFGAQGEPGRYSLRQFYEEASSGTFSFAGLVTRWIPLSKPRVQYMDHTNPAHGSRGMLTTYIREVLDSADAFVDWRTFDNDGPDGVPDSGDDDGFVDMVTFLHPLADGVCRRDALGGPVATGFRLSMLGAYGGSPFTTRQIGANGQRLKVEDFVLSAALHCDGNSIATMNINIHEMGHALGLPDLNDLDRSSYGVGVWDVMGYGLYATNGIPTQLGAWSRRQVGWATVTTVTTSTPLTLNPAIRSPAIARINIPGRNEYYLLENRQRDGADGGLPGTGLVIWRVDDDVMLPAVQGYGGTENELRPGLSVVQPDAQRHLQRKVNLGDAGDVYPGSAMARRASDDTDPSLRSHLGTASRIVLSNITEAAGVITMDVEVASVLTITVTPSQPAVLVGRSVRLDARVVSAIDGPVSLPITWVSLDPAVATVANDGTVLGVSGGVARILASTADASATTMVQVAGPIIAASDQGIVSAVVGDQGYSAALVATGGLTPLTWTATGPLPEGLTLSASGALAGEIRFLGDAVVGAAVTDALGQRAETSVTIRSTMPTIARSAMLEALAGGAALPAPHARALDLVGNRNGRLDVGDVLLELKRSAGTVPLSTRSAPPKSGATP